MIKHITKMFKADGIILGPNSIGIIPERVSVIYSIALNGFSTVSFSDDKNTSIQVVVDDNFKKMARELLK